MRTTIDLPDPLYRQLKAHAALLGMPMKEVVLAFVERGLHAPLEAAEPQPPARRELPTIRAQAALPREAFTNAGLFELLVSKGRIVIQPSDKVKYDLDTLVSGITTASAHDEADFGPPVGKEIL